MISTKNTLQEILMKSHQKLPTYSTTNIGGEGANSRFISTVFVFDRVFKGTVQFTKTDAEKSAAEEALKFHNSEKFQNTKLITPDDLNNDLRNLNLNNTQISPRKDNILSRVQSKDKINNLNNSQLYLESPDNEKVLSKNDNSIIFIDADHTPMAKVCEEPIFSTYNVVVITGKLSTVNDFKFPNYMKHIIASSCHKDAADIAIVMEATKFLIQYPGSIVYILTRDHFAATFTDCLNGGIAQLNGKCVHAADIKSLIQILKK